MKRFDAEVRRIVGEQVERATTLVAAHRDALSQLSAELLKAESLDGSTVARGAVERKPCRRVMNIERVSGA